MPPGRQPIVTAWRNETQEPSINKFIGERLAQGEQVFVVFPLVEESEKIDLQSAAEGFERFSRLFPQFRIGLLHGRLSGFEKDDVMRKFAAGEINLLVATTVIEVGVDVPNATVMLIEHAERFGLSQLHQLRGRIGRGKKKSWCILKTVGELTDIARRRIEIMTETNDGFKIAEVDLELRGWGDFFGTRQSGLPEFRMANIIRDRAWLEKARQDAGEILAGDPGLEKEEHQALKNAVNLFARRHLRQKRLS
jgi:ATP-dependent DNA helicase RecG